MVVSFCGVAEGSLADVAVKVAVPPVVAEAGNCALTIIVVETPASNIPVSTPPLELVSTNCTVPSAFQ